MARSAVHRGTNHVGQDATERFSYGCGIDPKVEEFLRREAALRDEWRLDDWFGLLADDGRFVAPTTDRPEGDPATDVVLVEDDQSRLQARVERLKSRFAHHESLWSRTRHPVSESSHGGAGTASFTSAPTSSSTVSAGIPGRSSAITSTSSSTGTAGWRFGAAAPCWTTSRSTSPVPRASSCEPGRPGACRRHGGRGVDEEALWQQLA